MTIRDEVNEWLEDQDNEKMAISDLLQHGCVSGMIPGMVYYSDTCKFYNDYKEEINNILSEALEEYGIPSPGKLFGDKWDSMDNLCLDTNNQNLLAWFAFEETARIIANDKGYEI